MPVLVYVGAIVALLLFATMLTKTPLDPSDELDRPRLPGALIAGGLGLAAVLIGAFGRSSVSLTGREIGDAAAMGEEIFANRVLLFEVLSLLLLAALIGAIVVSTRDALGNGRITKDN